MKLKQVVWMGMMMGLMFLVGAAPAAAQSWSLAASGIVGGSLPITVNGLKVTDSAVPLDLTTDGVTSKKAFAAGGRFRAFKRRDSGPEWGFNVDVRSFRYDGEAGRPNHVFGSVAGQRVDEIEISAGDESRVTMILGALLLRWPMGRTLARPDGLWSPYLGVGGGDQYVSSRQPVKFTSHAPSVQAMGGAEVMVSRRVSVFGEYRFEGIRDSVTIDTTNVRIRLSTNHFAGGVSIHF